MANNSEEIKFIYESLKRLSILVETFERCFSSLAISDDLLRELLTEIPEQLDRIESAILAMTNPGQPGMGQITEELEQEILRGHIESLKRQLRQQHKNRDLLQEDAAKYGPSVPLHLTNQIIGASVEIDRTLSEIDHFKGLINETDKQD